MFNQNSEYEEDFCEAYKSQILNKDSKEKESSFNVILKILTILLLLAIIVAISIYSYTYFTEQKSSEMSPPTSIQISDDELVVQEEDTDISMEKTVVNKKIEEKISEEVKSVIDEHIINKVEVSSVSERTITLEPKIEESVVKSIPVIIQNDTEDKKVPLEIKTPAVHIEETDIEQIANDVKLAIANSELAEEENSKKIIKESSEIKIEEVKVEKSEKTLEIPPASLEEQYLEELADLSRQIDKERK